MQRKVTKAIFPVAGLGTRFLPATKSIPKEIMTLVDRPLIQYAIDEARAAGIKEFIFVTSRGKGALEDYFDHAHELENTLHKAGKNDLLELLRQTNMDSGAIAYVRQHKAMGLGHAVWCARRLIGDEPFAVLLTDDVIAGDPPCLQQMIEAHRETGGSMVATMEVPREKTKSYGVLDVAEEELVGRFTQAVQQIASISLALNYPTIASVMHSFVNSYKNVLAISLATDYEYEGSAKLKEMLANPEAFAAAAAAAAPAADAGQAAPAAEEKKEEPEEESDGDMGFGLFD